MKIIALHGASNVGKSTCLNIVFESLAPIAASFSPKVVLGDPVHRDFESVITFHSGVTLAFFTMGDYSVYLTEAINKYEAIGVDVLIVALNDRFVKPRTLISSFPDHHFVLKSRLSSGTEKDIALDNLKTSQAIISLL